MLVSADTILSGSFTGKPEKGGALRTTGLAKATIISKQTAVTIGGGAANDTVLSGILIVKALTGTCVITGFSDSDGAAKTITLPAATPAGFINFDGAVNDAGALTITCSNAGDDDNVIVKSLAIV